MGRTVVGVGGSDRSKEALRWARNQARLTESTTARGFGVGWLCPTDLGRPAAGNIGPRRDRAPRRGGSRYRRAGEPARACTIFERAAAFVNDVGLLAEEVDPVSGELLGNFPQAFSHIGLVNAAWAISKTELRQQSSAEVSAASRPGSSSA